MDLHASLENDRSKKNILKIIKWIGNDEARFSQLMQLILKKDYELSWRAAWPMSYCIQKHPALAKKYFPQFLKLLKTKNIHQGVTRNVLRALQQIEIPEKFQGEIISVCFEFLMNNSETIANRAFSITVLGNICSSQPELKQELKQTLSFLLEQEQTAAIYSRAKNELKKMDFGSKKI